MNFLFFLICILIYIYINILIYLALFFLDKEYNNNCFLFAKINSFQILKLLINNILNTNLYLVHIYVLQI